MRFYKEVWGIIWEFNGIGEYISFCIGRVIGVIIFFGGIFLLSKCENLKPEITEENTYEVIDESVYTYDYEDI